MNKNDSTHSNNKCELTYDDMVKMKEHFKACDLVRHEVLKEWGISIDTKYTDPFALLMLKEGFDPENDYLIIPKKEVEKLSPYIAYPLPSYIKISKYVDQIILVKGKEI